MKTGIVTPLFIVFSCVAPAFAQTLTLWPSELCEARKHADSEVAQGAQGTLLVTTGTRYEWPGVTVFFKAGEYDLAEYGALQVTVSNTAERPLTVSLSVKNHGQKGASPGGQVWLRPGGQGVITASLRPSPWVLDKPLELVGMRGFPSSLEGGTFNVRKAAELHLFIANPDRPARFAVTRIAASRQPLNMLKTDTFLPFVDRFGQFAHDEWPGKIHSEEALRQAKDREDQELAEHRGPADRDAWGGWTGGPQLKATGHFRTEKVDGFWWLVDPDGRLFFSHGVDCVRPGAETGVQHREAYFAWLPAQDTPFAPFYGTSGWAPHGFYKDKGSFKTFDFAGANLFRKDGEGWRAAFADRAHRRIRAWGLNTVANWSDSQVYLLRRTPYTATFRSDGPRIEGSEGWWGKFPDPFSQEFAETLRKRAAEQQKAGTAADPWCIGYFVDNELSWGKDDRDLARATLLSPAGQPAKLALRAWLEKKYATPAALNAAWGTSFAAWEDFLQNTAKPDEKRCAADLEAFHAQIAEQYFRTVREAIKAVAPEKLYLGCRIAWGSPGVYRAAAKFCDVVSVNIYQRQADKDLPEGSEDKPMINGEFHFGALDRGLFHTGLVATRDQAERAACYTAFVTSCLKHPRYVGTHWFQWRDQALTGRGDGENYQIGFLSVTDQPHPELVAAAREIGAAMYGLRHRAAGR